MPTGPLINSLQVPFLFSIYFGKPAQKITEKWIFAKHNGDINNSRSTYSLESTFNVSNDNFCRRAAG